MPNVNDLRYLRTETAIKDAFIALVAEKPLRSITAVEVCQRAGISRNAFYLHYAGVSALYESLIQGIMDDVLAQCEKSVKQSVATKSPDEQLVSVVMDAVSKHERLMRALLPFDDGTLARQFAEDLSKAYYDLTLTIDKEQKADLSYSLMCSYASWALVGFIRCWITNTDRPLTQAVEDFTLLHAGVYEVCKNYLASYA